MNTETMLQAESVSEELIKFADFYRDNYDELTSSDMQGIASARALKIVNLITKGGVA
jgi:hypothetical protein